MNIFRKIFFRAGISILDFNWNLLESEKKTKNWPDYQQTLSIACENAGKSLVQTFQYFIFAGTEIGLSSELRSKLMSCKQSQMSQVPERLLKIVFILERIKDYYGLILGRFMMRKVARLKLRFFEIAMKNFVFSFDIKVMVF